MTEAGLYIHIPFCKKACHYCSFYFVVSPTQITNYKKALIQEIKSRSDEAQNYQIQTIYFGGGTPTMLGIHDFSELLEVIFQNFHVASDAEISTESNPENLSIDYVNDLKSLGFNRLSIGIQSFHDQDLVSMNRAHTSEDAHLAITNANNFFDNVSIDLIFGLPYSGIQNWISNIERSIQYNVPHISTYNLTVEEKTALARKIKRKEMAIEPDDTLNEMYLYTILELERNGYQNYEISNFSKIGFESKHNHAYWIGKPYLGFGPSAHSYDGKRRKENISNLKNYMNAIHSGDSFSKIEVLSPDNQFNEFILTRLRIKEGILTSEIRSKFGDNAESQFSISIQPFILSNHVLFENGQYQLTNTGKLIADFISAELML